MSQKEFLDLPELSAEQCEIIDRAAQLLAELDGGLIVWDSNRARLHIGEFSCEVQADDDGKLRPATVLMLARAQIQASNAN